MHTLSAVFANEMLNSGRRALETAGMGLCEEEENCHDKNFLLSVLFAIVG